MRKAGQVGMCLSALGLNRCVASKKAVVDSTKGGNRERPKRAGKPGSVESGHFSRTAVARRLKRPTREGLRAGPARDGFPFFSLRGLAPGGVCRAGRSPGLLVRSYRTVSPLPRDRSLAAVYFLLHFPCPCGRWALPTTVSCGARTFLSEAPPSRRIAAFAAAAWPASAMLPNCPRSMTSKDCRRLVQFLFLVKSVAWQATRSRGHAGDPFTGFGQLTGPKHADKVELRTALRLGRSRCGPPDPVRHGSFLVSKT